LPGPPHAGCGDASDLTHPSERRVPYTGIQNVALPEFQAIGTEGRQNVAAVLTGQMTVDTALFQSQSETASIMQQVGYGQ
jgi:sorbitol/mannitol transport system substrate-binding protein